MRWAIARALGFRRFVSGLIPGGTILDESGFAIRDEDGAFILEDV